MPRRTLDAIVPGMMASSSSSSRPDAGKAVAGQGLSNAAGGPSTSAPAGVCPGTPRKDGNEPVDETFIEVRTSDAVESVLQAVAC